MYHTSLACAWLALIALAALGCSRDAVQVTGPAEVVSSDATAAPASPASALPLAPEPDAGAAVRTTTARPETDPVTSVDVETMSAGAPAAGSGSAAAGSAGSPLGAAGSSGSGSPAPAPPACPHVSLKVGDQSFSIASKNGLTYSYILSVPKTVDPRQRAPLIVHWHALGSDPEEARKLTSIDAKAETAKALVVYPRSPDKSWDVGSCCSAVLGGVPRDEEVFARELIRDVIGKACVDDQRIYTNGFSNGGMVSQMLACKMSDVFAAAAPMGSTLTIDESECKPRRAMPLLLINGTADPLVGYSAAGFAGGMAFTADTSFWAALNGCSGTPELFVQQGKATCKRYTHCIGNEVDFCEIEGMGHCVPGMLKESATNCLTKSGLVLGMPNDDIDALQLSVDFLLRFSLR